MRRFPTTPLIVILALVGIVGAWQLFAQTERARYLSVNAVKTSRSYIKLTMDVTYPAGRIATERYILIDDDGKSKATYVVSDRKGTIATFHETIRGYDVAFAFDKVVQDGIWEINSKHQRTLEDVKYTVSIDQTAQAQSGSRKISFTDPHYWATAAGRQYRIHLDPKKPTPTAADLLRLDSTSTADPRYEKIVSDFQTFGSPTFKRTVASARSKLLKS
ncbi:MAG: hypothetical protein NVSMB64_02180 [Candidatus Velthaea sp.]